MYAEKSRLAPLSVYRLEDHGIWDPVPEPVCTRIKAGVRGQIPDTLKSGDPVFSRVINQMTGSFSEALSAALDDLLVTGPTRINVMDMQILLVST